MPAWPPASAASLRRARPRASPSRCLWIVPSDLVTIVLLVLLEGLLSADNAMVLAILVLGLPRDQQQKALRYGILGAFASASSRRLSRRT